MNRGFGYVGLLLMLSIIALFIYAMLEALSPVASEEGTQNIESSIDKANESANSLRKHNSNIESSL